MKVLKFLLSGLIWGISTFTVLLIIVYIMASKYEQISFREFIYSGMNHFGFWIMFFLWIIGGHLIAHILKLEKNKMF